MICNWLGKLDRGVITNMVYNIRWLWFINVLFVSEVYSLAANRVFKIYVDTSLLIMYSETVKYLTATGGPSLQ